MQDHETIQKGRLPKSQLFLRSIRGLPPLVALIATSGTLYAQAGATGTILGTVTDASGAVVPNATVTVTNAATGATVRITSSSSGDYQAPSLNPGNLSVSAEMSGFQVC